MARSTHFLRYSGQYGAILLMVYILINNTINATSDIMEAQRDGVLPFQLWEPFVWEYSSALSTLILVPGVIYLLKYQPFNFQAITRSLCLYIFASIVFSVLHVAIMVALRKLVYWSQASSYDFGLLWYEFLYEYRKDVWGFLFLIMAIKGYQYLIGQLKGEAHVLQQTEESVKPQFERLLVRKLGKEFIIKVNDIEWLESAGNYVNLHIGGRIYPLRATLTKLSEQLEPQGFCRIHRSHAVRLDAISSITPIQSGDSEVTLISGKKLNLSRRYKEQFKGQLRPN
ncbi:LytTR family DNA-binding domain-containing protein [Pseudoalteromonas sp. BZB3]|uniref:LytR/AlgR family response regulator transcription factor n=1 Tax=Pseudoalteromonas sp. BZB3 TaxID=3136670 RepID=UPI0032C40FDF